MPESRANSTGESRCLRRREPNSWPVRSMRFMCLDFPDLDAEDPFHKLLFNAIERVAARDRAFGVFDNENAIFGVDRICPIVADMDTPNLDPISLLPVETLD